MKEYISKITQTTFVYINNHYGLIVGGYIGLFIGYTIAQAPELANQLMRYTVETIKYFLNHGFE
jgi:hypothetical protein